MYWKYRPRVNDQSHRRLTISTILSIIVLSLLACSDDTPINRLSDFDLAEKHKECVARKPTAPGAMMACNNIRRECDRRHRELGNYICAN